MVSPFHRLREGVRGTFACVRGRCAYRVSVALLAAMLLAGVALGCASPGISAVAFRTASAPRLSAASENMLTDPTRVLPPTLMPTVAPTLVTPLRLAVVLSILNAERDFFDHLVRQHPALVLEPCPTSAEALHLWQRGQTSAAIVRATLRPALDALLLRSIPYVLVGPVTSGDGEISLQRLRGVYAGTDSDWQAIICGDGASEALLLGLDHTAPTLSACEAPEMALRQVAISERTLAIIPWESTDFRVRTMAIGDHRLWSEPLGEYPYTLRWWLVGDLAEDTRRELSEGLSRPIEEPVSLLAVGDIMLARYVGELIAKDSPTYPFEDKALRDLLSAADIAFGNLECPISERGAQQDKGYEFRAAPASVGGLSYAGFDVVSLANNHTGDYGDVALLDTLEALSQVNIIAVGAGGDLEEALSVRAMQVKGVQVGFLAFNAIGPQWFEATEWSPGSAWLDPEVAVRVVRAAAEKTDLLVVSCHWGTEYTAYPTAFQQLVARELTEAGADLIVGHHPHVLQAVQYFDSGFAAYSLGNFVFDQFFDQDVRQGAILYCLADRTGLKSVELVPTYNWRAQPRILEPDDAAPVLERLFRVTREIGGLPSGAR